jgi:hypothetical protein
LPAATMDSGVWNAVTVPNPVLKIRQRAVRIINRVFFI